MRRLSSRDVQSVEAVIEANKSELWKPGVLGLEPGFPIVDGQLVREKAIIVYVERKRPLDQLLKEDRLPDKIRGIQVDVVEPGPWKALELTREDPLLQELDTAAASKLTYEPIAKNPINESFRITKPIRCHVGPDSGWVELRQFIAETRKSLTVAMFDFSADYVADALIEQARTRRFPISLVLDDDVRPAERGIQERLRDKLAGSYNSAIVKCGGNRRFPSAYHPKVAVQDSRRFWLSSGNWSPRSQPGVDPLGEPASAAGLFGRANREWHVVVDDQKLAKQFEFYILRDKEQAIEDAALGDAGRTPFPDLFVPLDDLLLDFETAALAAPALVAPAMLPDHGKAFTVRPLLSPDNYAEQIESWIRGAKRSLWLQYAYITYSDLEIDNKFRGVLDHLAELSWRDDREFELKIIVGSNDKEKVRKLAENGFNEAKIKVQSNIHNKAIVRDGTEVLVSSQNWSGDGFLRNRDAGLIIEDEQIARYFGEVLLNDWNARARDPFTKPGPAALIAPPGAATPPGMVRMSWADFMGE